jgi:deazaflavin-dependent oxidoreductase (nitroreductase family)
MPDLQRLKRRIVHTAQRLVVNPVGRRSPMTMLETTGRKSGQPRRTAIGGWLVGNEFWMVSEHGEHSHYVLSIKANPAVRLRGLPGVNSALVRLLGSDQLTIRVDLA